MGAKKAIGEILVFVDADMTFDKNFIFSLVQPIILGKSVGTFSKDEYLGNKESIWAICWNINRGLPRNKMHPENYPDSQKVFRAIKKSKFTEAGGFNEKAGYTDDWSLSEKLGLEASAAENAVFFHKNPATLREVYIQSKWMAKRKYRLGYLGYLLALLRVSFPVSLVKGVFISLAERIPAFLIFKLVSDWASFVGIVEFIFIGKVSK